MEIGKDELLSSARRAKRRTVPVGHPFSTTLHMWSKTHATRTYTCTLTSALSYDTPLQDSDIENPYPKSGYPVEYVESKLKRVIK